MGTLINMGMLIMKNNSEEKFHSIGESRAKQSERIIKEAFDSAGWQVNIGEDSEDGCPDIIVKRPEITYLIEIKTSAEGCKDRLIPLWSQIFLESSCLAGEDKKPLAIVAAPKIAPSVARQVLDFAAKYAPGAAVGVIDPKGLRMFRGPHLEELNFEEKKAFNVDRQPAIYSPINLFSDLN